MPWIRRAAAAPLATLELHGPPASPSITLAYAAGAGLLRSVADKVSFKVWRTPDEMRAGLTSGGMQALVMPVTAAANLHKRGLGVRLAFSTGTVTKVSAPNASTSGLRRPAFFRLKK